MLDAILDDPFLACALAAFLDEASESGCMPDPERTRVRAYRYYEAELQAKHSQVVDDTSPVKDRKNPSELVLVDSTA